MNPVSGRMWQVSLEGPWALALAVHDALEAEVDSLSIFRTEGGAGGKAGGGDEQWAVVGLLAGPPDYAAILKAVARGAESARLPTPEADIYQLPEIDWLAENRRSFPSLHYGRFLIHPTHERAAAALAAKAGRLVIEMDAGRAFGSGTHGTTEGCLHALAEVGHSLAVKRVLDLGCGSGILAIAATRLWPAAMVAARDIDPNAVAATLENVQANRAGARLNVSRGDGYPRRGAGRGHQLFDLVVANILAGPLVVMAPDAARALRPGGRIILSGLLIEQERAVLATYIRCGFALIRRRHVAEWSTLILSRRGSRRGRIEG